MFKESVMAAPLDETHVPEREHPDGIKKAGQEDQEALLLNFVDSCVLRRSPAM